MTEARQAIQLDSGFSMQLSDDQHEDETDDKTVQETSYEENSKLSCCLAINILNVLL